MSDRLRNYWERLRSGLWFVPLVISLLVAALAEILIYYGAGDPRDGAWAWLIYSGDASTARDTLSTLLSGMITMTSLVVSIMIVVLTLAAGQLGPRLVRNFIGDIVTQVALGIFLATILYLLLVMRGIYDVQDDDLPHLAVAVGTALPMLCLFVLLVFVHRLARSIMADNVIGRVTRELREHIAYLMPERDADAPPPPPMPKEVAWLALQDDGYIQSVDYDSVAKAAKRADARIWFDVRPGHYVTPHGRHVAVAPRAALDERLTKAVCDAIMLGADRTPTQDLEYGIRQLVEIALRALSPGINDPFTADVVIDNLAASLGMAFDRCLMPQVVRDDAGAVRVVRDISGYPGLVAAAFDQIRQAGKDKPAILIQMADALRRLSPYIRTEEQRRAVVAQLDKVLETGRLNLRVAEDLADLEMRCAAAREHLTPEGVEHRDWGKT